MNKELTRKRMNRKRAATVAMTMVASGTLIAGAIFAAPLWINPSTPAQVEPTQVVVTPTPDSFNGLGSSLRSRPIPEYEASVSLAPPIIAGAPQEPDAPDAEETHKVPGSLQVSLSPAEADSTGSEGGTVTLSPTYSWVNAFSIESTVNGQPLPVGAVVAAYDPDGVLVGRSIVQSEGKYGLMALYMDDPSTPEDEGADPGDQIRFEINGTPAAVLGPHNPVWSSNGAVLMLNLAANSRLAGAP